MKRCLNIFALLFSIVLLSFTFEKVDNSIGKKETLEYFRQNIYLFHQETTTLLRSIQQIDAKDSITIKNALDALKNTRLAFKRIEFFTEYFFKTETSIFNSAPKVEVEEPTLEYVEPMGLQQIEALLTEDNAAYHKDSLYQYAQALHESVRDLPALLYNFELNDEQILESIRIELIRMLTLSITGYDAPVLKTGIAETLVAIESIQEILQPYIRKGGTAGVGLKHHLHACEIYLKKNQDFDSFNRMEFIINYGFPIQKELGILIKDLNLELNSTKYLKYNENLFSRHAIKKLDTNLNLANLDQRVLLGKKLFFDKNLSGNLSVSCATCHQPQNYFNDNLSRSASLNKNEILKRNTPSLLYAGWQHTLFWEGRAKNLQEQIKDVVFNPSEMNGSHQMLYENVIESAKYAKLLQSAFPDRHLKQMGIDEISMAISAFVQDLNPMNSAFDKYVAGDKNAMTTNQINGFNLFMGKAQCGTCHFPPYFNSLLPPLYEISEVEVLGTLKTDDFRKIEADPDQGRYDVFKVPYYLQAFKTPTVRNAQKTAPYMHNGAFNSLESVLEFYNLGGAAGMGLPIKHQTLSSSPLNLSKKEINDVIQFINSLTDTITYPN